MIKSRRTNRVGVVELLSNPSDSLGETIREHIFRGREDVTLEELKEAARSHSTPREPGELFSQ